MKVKMKKFNGTSCKEFIRASDPHSVHVERHPGRDSSWGFFEWMKRLSRGGDMNGEFVRWTKSYEYIRTNSIRWIGLCCTYGETPYICQSWRPNGLFQFAPMEFCTAQTDAKTKRCSTDVFVTEDIQIWRGRANVPDYSRLGLAIQVTGDRGLVLGLTGTSTRL
jgi:hypothetical protein